MLHKPLFIIHVKVKGSHKSYTVVQKQITSVNCKSGHSTHILYFSYVNARFQVSVQINEVLLYNKIKQTRII